MKRRLLMLTVATLTISLLVGGALVACSHDPVASPPERSEMPCDQDFLGGTDGLEFVSARYVLEGELAAVCLGSDDRTLEDAWNELTLITPVEQLTTLVLFGGFVSSEDGDDETLAYVSSADDLGSTYLMAVNLDAYDAEEDEAALTMAHEFSHVFTQLPDQLDRSGDPESCASYFNGEGCYLPDSLMNEWIEQFWTPEQLATIDPDAEVFTDNGAERCDLDAGFFGTYAATTPEEDFAEAFSAYVFGVEAATAGQQQRLDYFADRAELAEFRERAAEADRGPLANNFEVCGS